MAANKGKATNSTTNADAGTREVTSAQQAVASAANNEEAAKAAETDSAAAAAQSESGTVGTYGSEVTGDEGKTKDGVYTVKDGDTLESIASENDTTAAELVALNPDLRARSNFVYTGQEIRLK